MSNSLDHYKEMEPKADLKTYFTGPIKAWGIIQDWRGRVVERFDVKMVGTWEGNKGRLEEDFVYYDGREQKRIWHITQLEDGSFEGRADDIIDKAKGAQSGNALQWAYQMDIETGGSTYRITFDDWMFQMNDGVLINRSYLKKFGFTVAELTLFMKKED
jgi:hypothetical protein